MLPAKGPWEHPYYALEDVRSNVRFDDAEGLSHTVAVRHKATGNGPPLVLVHGLMTSSYSWRYVLEPLARRYRVYALDLVGAGASDKPLDLVYSVANVARFLAAWVRDVVREPIYLVGNSLGGLYGLRMLTMGKGGSAPGAVRRFVLMHSPGYPLLRSRFVASTLGAPMIGAAVAGLVARVAHRYPAKFIANNVHYARKDVMSEEECAEYGRLFETLDGARVFAKILEESLDPAEHAAIIEELRRRRRAGTPPPCPIKLMFARKDPMVPPSFGPRYHEDLPGSELVWIDDASHFVQVDAPEKTVAEIVAFDAAHASDQPSSDAGASKVAS
jgi:pimeloyl-ACP methyl ester carboxylesterase